MRRGESSEPVALDGGPMDPIAKSAIRMVVSLAVVITNPVSATTGAIAIEYEADLVCAPENEDPACFTSAAVGMAAAHDDGAGPPATIALLAVSAGGVNSQAATTTMICNRPLEGVCTAYSGRERGPAQLEVFRAACADGEWGTTPCPTDLAFGNCSASWRPSDFEPVGITQTMHVYSTSSLMADDARQLCATGGLSGMRAVGYWTTATATPADSPDQGRSTEPSGRACADRNADLVAMNIDDIACEADEIQYGFRP